jgi:hypothetical protein
MTTPPLAEVPIRSAAELTERWSTVLDPPVFGARGLWIMWLDDDGRMFPVVVPIDDLPRLPDSSIVSGLLAVHEGVAEEHLGGGGHVALALCRPGRPEVTDDDDAWVGVLSEVLDDRLDGGWSLHLAAAGRVTALIDPPSDFRRS